MCTSNYNNGAKGPQILYGTYLRKLMIIILNPHENTLTIDVHRFGHFILGPQGAQKEPENMLTYGILLLNRTFILIQWYHWIC